MVFFNIFLKYIKLYLILKLYLIRIYICYLNLTKNFLDNLINALIIMYLKYFFKIKNNSL